MGMTKALYQDFLDRAGVDPSDDDAIARYIAEVGGMAQVDKAFREFTASQITTPQIKMHKTDKIANIEQEEGDWL